jgi:hypothetical protein
MDLTEEIRKIAVSIPAELKEDKKGFSLEKQDSSVGEGLIPSRTQPGT